jgi:hypothetical protein
MTDTSSLATRIGTVFAGVEWRPPGDPPWRRLPVQVDNEKLQALEETGATGLEPATSGVTVGRRALPLIAVSRY